VSFEKGSGSCLSETSARRDPCLKNLGAFTRKREELWVIKGLREVVVEG
jgi:hypothetical protein